MTTTTTTGTWQDSRLEPAHRADLLLVEMTVAEKCHQLTSRMPWSMINADGSDAVGADAVLRNPPGHIAQLIQNDAGQLAAMVGRIQHQVLSRSRLGIPVLFHAEALSGFLAGGHMVFPSGTGLGAGWSPDLVELGPRSPGSACRWPSRPGSGPAPGAATTAASSSS